MQEIIDMLRTWNDNKVYHQGPGEGFNGQDLILEIKRDSQVGCTFVDAIVKAANGVSVYLKGTP